MVVKRKSVFRKTEKGRNKAVKEIMDNRNKAITSIRKSKTPKGFKIHFSELQIKAKRTASKKPKTTRVRSKSKTTSKKGIFHPYSDLF